jgi:flagellar hook-associated protein 1
MASTFMGLSIASRGLSASQVGLNVTTNNMSNIDTTGYSRQLVTQTSVGPAAVYSSSLVGGGTEVTSVDRVRSFRLDQKYWQENSASSALEAKSTYLTEIESYFGASDTDYISTALNTFTTALSTLSTDSSDSSVRETVLEDAQSFCATLNNASTELTQLRSDLNTEVSTAVDQINDYASGIAALNGQISLAKAVGGSTNELEDQRDALVDKLSGVVGISVISEDDGSFTINTKNGTLVSGKEANALECYTVTDTTSAQCGMYGIRWSDSGEDFAVGDSGSISGYLEVRDGSSEESKGIPYYINQLNEFARSFAQAFNEGVTVGTTSYSGHADGAGIDDSETTGIRFFSYDDLSSADLMASGTDTEAVYKNITAANISLSKDIQDDTDLIACASISGEDGNNENLNDIISICNDVDISGSSTATESYNKIIADLSTSSSYTQTQYDRKNTLATYIDTSRSSVSGVSSDEETINLTKYQSAYDASAAAVKTWSQIYDSTLDMVND